MHDNQIRDEGLAKYDNYMQEATAWRRARVPANEELIKAAPIKRLGLAGVTVVNLLIGR